MFEMCGNTISPTKLELEKFISVRVELFKMIQDKSEPDKLMS